MDIRVFVLGDDRAAPTNYRHVLVNPLKIDWLTQASNYKEVISNAVDAFMADGRAFVTEYAGTSGIVQQFGLYDPEWGDQVFIGLPPTSVISVLNSQGLSYCVSEFTCEWYHPLVYGLLLEFLPPPDGVDPIQFYPYLSDYAGQIDMVKWNDGADFAAAMLSRIIEPGQHATLLLDTWPYLTRMYTTISPSEMMEDPIFHLNPDLADVDQFRQADNYNLCNGDSVTTLPDGREVYVPNGFSWPDIPGETWWEEEVQAVALKGAPMTLVNNTAAINKVLEAWNLAHGWPRGADSESTGDWWTGTGGLGPDGGIGNEPGCGCRSSEPRGLWLGLGLLGLRVRRRR